MDDRLSHDDLMVQYAELVARRSLCYRSRTGAVVCSADRRLLGIGWNAPPKGLDTQGLNCSVWCPRGSGLSHAPNYQDCNAVHAEPNALLHAERGDTVGGTMYVTRVPCAPCAKQIAASGIARLVHGQDEGGVYHRPEEVLAMLSAFGVEVESYGG